MAPRTTATKRRRLNSTSLHATLPFDPVLEILYRLPVKSLVQFKSVCKSWKSLISHPKFAKNHLRLSTTRHHLFFPHLSKHDYTFKTCPISTLFTRKITPTATATLQLDYPLSHRGVNFDQIRGSCHGIFCIELYRSFAVLWNPSIRKFAKLPSLEIQGSNTLYSGFGYDHSTDTYKVVAFSGVYQVQTYVHTMGTNFWTRIQDFPHCVPEHESGKFINGTLNWLACNNSAIVSLDLEKGSYREILLLDYGEIVITKSLWVLRECLCTLSSHTDGHSEGVWK